MDCPVAIVTRNMADTSQVHVHQPLFVFSVKIFYTDWLNQKLFCQSKFVLFQICVISD